MPLPLPAVEIVGDEGEASGNSLSEALEQAGLVVAETAGVVVVAGPASVRAGAAQAAVASGRDAFVAWPPGSVAEAAALLALAEEAGVEVGVERPLGEVGPAGPVRLVVVTVGVANVGGWPRAIAGALDACACLAGTRGSSRLDAEAERDGAALKAVAVTLRFRNGAFAQALVRQTAEPVASVTVYADGADETVLIASRLGDEAAAFVQAVAAGRRAPYGLDDALATMRLAERVMTSLR